MQQSDPRTLRPILRPIAPGQTPIEALDRAFREETGLIVMPVRLTGVHYDSATGELIFAYRCTMRGGDLVIPEGRPPAGFFDCPPLPAGLDRRFRHLTDVALHHPGGPPVLEESGGLSSRLGRLIGRRADEAHGTDWDVSVRLEADVPDDVVRCAIGDLDVTNATAIPPATPPWRTAERLAQGAAVQLTRIEIAHNRPVVVLVFTPRNP